MRCSGYESETYTHKLIHACRYACVPRYIDMCIQTYIYTHIYIHTYELICPLLPPRVRSVSSPETSWTARREQCVTLHMMHYTIIPSVSE